MKHLLTLCLLLLASPLFAQAPERRLTDEQLRATVSNARGTFAHLLSATQMASARLAAIEALLAAEGSYISTLSAPAVSDADLLASVEDISESIAALTRAANLTDRQLSAVKGELGARVADKAAADNAALVTYPNERIGFIVGPQVKAGSSPWPWFDRMAAQQGLALFEQFGADVDTYYDYALTQYIAYYRTGDARHLEAARASADHWTSSQMPKGRGTAPRSLAAGGVMLRAMELETTNPARADSVWSWLTDWATHHDFVWIARHYDRNELWYGVRDGAYTLLTMAQLAEVHPDAAVRADMLERVKRASLDYFVRLQREDGGWYWTANGLNAPDGEFSQPFMVGMLMEALVATHQLTGDPMVAKSIVRGVDWLWRQYEPTTRLEVPGDFGGPGLTWRAMPYFAYPDGTTSGFPHEIQTHTVREKRQLNPLTIHAFGYAYLLTGDPKYREQGDEIFASTFGRGEGPGADSQYGLADYRAKENNQSYRTAGRYLAWRLR